MTLEKRIQNIELTVMLELSFRSDQGLPGFRRPLIGKRFRSNPPPCLAGGDARGPSPSGIGAGARKPARLSGWASRYTVASMLDITW
jgi:hypothetical protein